MLFILALLVLFIVIVLCMLYVCFAILELDRIYGE